MIKGRRLPHLRTLVFVAVGIVLVWLVVRQSIAAYLAGTAPKMALWLNSEQPSALVALAEHAVESAGQNIGPDSKASLGKARQSKHASEANGVPNPGDAQMLSRTFSAFEAVGHNVSVTRPLAPDNAPEVRNWAETALLDAPLNAHALRILGQLAEAGDDDARATDFMRVAARLSLHESIATYWVMQRAARERDYKSALYYADVLLRIAPELGSRVIPVLARMAQDKSANALLKRVLASNPPWRQQFFESLSYDVTDPRVPLDLLTALRHSTAPPTPKEVGYYIDFLTTYKLYRLAYYTWLQFLPPEELRHAGMLFNGNFDVVPSGLPFDWQIEPGTGVTIDIVPIPGKSEGHGLLVDFQYGRVEFHDVKELVMLAPGTYNFIGKYKGQLVGPRGLKWRVACVGGAPAYLGESPMIIGAASEWKAVEFTFTVPANCPAEDVSLELDARMQSEQLVSGSVVFGDLRITRAADPS